MPTVSGLPYSFAMLARQVHADNLMAGWWKTDEFGNTVPRNIGELLCLVHSEISEADEGFIGDLKDDKLPHRKMFEVELADVSIRVLDILGYYRPDIELHIDFGQPKGFPRKLGDAIRLLHRTVSAAMEHFRKSRSVDGCRELVRLMNQIHCIAIGHGLDLSGAIKEKRAFNRTRVDHQLATRAGVGGKAW